MMQDDDLFLKAYLEDRQNIVEEALQRYLPEDGFPSDIYKAVHYSVFNGGKRIRPILCLAAAEAVGGDLVPAIPVACALELIHSYSLIHDDLPSMDNDDFRRGKPTCHKVFGENMAILAGDALLTEAFVLLSRAEKVMLSAERRLAIIQEIANAAGINGMVGGQALDVISEKTGADETILQDIHRRKTGALIVAAVKSGAVMFNAGKDKIQALTEYGMHVGLAFQIADDILNVEGDSRLMGKGTGSDAARNKMTYPSLMGLQQAKEKLNQHVEAAVTSLADFDERAMPLIVIARYIRDRKS
ncbi:MAG TPA: polyprenyl synthetase family protein [Smithella sp.]|jgi:geranylgeranyl diphosphate synthase type II|nr:MAG: Farnesyl diphosphate synthase [Deltaproteobacteria bacterium ADurb.Bin022]HNQ65598.1 polyprenyl synthetase family protein [Smithella sp.]HOE32566.1 polyprenyl synthetase family protein [Smithella sp.]HOG09177.1 polyprenyl synthetase family protein [Smithella sp.]HOO35120.1 polyprenyl synthetase family protein [Smithella sp.]